MMNSLDLSRYQSGVESGSKSTGQPASPEIKKDSEGGYMHKKVSGQ
jgi:hypothetical protein